MAVGVPENEVFTAADVVLARGERPTVERVRLELGRGSPARVGGLLDIWWARLAERLSGRPVCRRYLARCRRRLSLCGSRRSTWRRTSRNRV